MGYTSHRENVQDGYSAKKITIWDNLKIKKDKIGQDVNPFVTNNDSFSIPKYQDILSVIGCRDDEKCVNTEISLT
jgi:site-specific DNA-cytosine methylase